MEETGVVDVREILEKALQEAEEFRKNPVIGDISYNQTNDYILINTGLNYIYDVDVKQLNSKKEVLNWIFHLNQKVWMTNQKMGDFIKMISRITDIWDIIHTGGIK